MEQLKKVKYEKLTKYKFSDLYEMSSGISSSKEQAGHGSPFISFSKYI